MPDQVRQDVTVAGTVVPVSVESPAQGAVQQPAAEREDEHGDDAGDGPPHAAVAIVVGPVRRLDVGRRLTGWPRSAAEHGGRRGGRGGRRRAASPSVAATSTTVGPGRG